jgi:hypothetical protein
LSEDFMGAAPVGVYETPRLYATTVLVDAGLFAGGRKRGSRGVCRRPTVAWKKESPRAGAFLGTGDATDQ